MIVRDLSRAVDQIPRPAHAAEAKPLRTRYEKSSRRRRTGPQAIGTLLVSVLARLGVTDVESDSLKALKLLPAERLANVFVPMAGVLVRLLRVEPVKVVSKVWRSDAS